MTTAAARPSSTAAHIGRALRHRSYRLFFAGQGTSLIGTWLTRVAMSWLVYRLTHSAALLGVVGFVAQIPTFLLAPFAGVLIERWSRRKVLLVTQTLAMLQSALLAVVTLTGVVAVWQLLVLGAFQGLINAFDTPARQTFVVEMLESRDDLPSAIALNSMMVNGARLLGPSIAGVLIAAVGEGWCFTADAVSYLAVIASLLAMRITARPRTPGKTRVLHELAEGFRYVKEARTIRVTLLFLAFVSLTAVPYMVLMPIFAGEVFHGGANTLGLLTAAAGAGAIGGALWLASRRTTAGLTRIVPAAGGVFGLGLVSFAFTRSLWLAVPLLVATGAGMMVQMTGSNTILQTVVSDDKRSRVMSFFTMAFFGMMPLGSLMAGLLGARIGAPATVALGGLATVLAAILFARGARPTPLSG